MVVRAPDRSGPLLERVLAAYGIPFALQRRLPLRPHRDRSRPVRAAPVRPGQRRRRGPAGLAARARAARPPRAGRPARGAAAARGRHRPRHRRARGSRTAPSRSTSSTARPRPRRPARARWSSASTARSGVCWRRRGGGPRACSTARSAPTRRPRRLRPRRSGRAGRPRARPGRAGRARRPARGSCRSRWGSGRGPGLVAITDPLAIRARRYRTVVVAGLQEGELPRLPTPDPFLDDGLRARLQAAGLPLAPRDALADERHLFYACVSRPTERLVLAYRTADEEGGLATPSFFLDDVRALYAAPIARRERPLAQVAWPPQDAPTEAERARARAAAQPPVEPPVLGSLEGEAARAALVEQPRDVGQRAGVVRRLPGALARGPPPAPARARARLGAAAAREPGPPGAGLGLHRAARTARARPA